jgi:glycerol-3-phosphate acyltransferase PlsX
LRGRLAYLLLRPGIARIRGTFDYEKVGGSPLLGVRGTVIITHGRARRRMIGFAIEVGARMARARVPDLIAESLGGTARSANDPTGAAPPAAAAASVAEHAS